MRRMCPLAVCRFWPGNLGPAIQSALGAKSVFFDILFRQRAS